MRWLQAHAQIHINGYTWKSTEKKNCRDEHKWTDMNIHTDRSLNKEIKQEIHETTALPNIPADSSLQPLSSPRFKTYKLRNLFPGPESRHRHTLASQGLSANTLSWSLKTQKSVENSQAKDPYVSATRKLISVSRALPASTGKTRKWCNEGDFSLWLYFLGGYWCCHCYHWQNIH